MVMASSIGTAQQKGSASQTVAFAVMRTIPLGTQLETTNAVQLQTPVKMSVSFDGKNVETRDLQQKTLTLLRPETVQTNLSKRTKPLVTITD